MCSGFYERAHFVIKVNCFSNDDYSTMAEIEKSFDEEADSGDFEILMAEGDEWDEDSTFRTQNDPSKPLQRNNIVERKGAVDVRCTAADVIHGTLMPDGEPATLLVYDFYFDPRKKARRIAEAHMSFIFSATGGAGTPNPEVLKISPKGRMTLVPTTAKETTIKGGDVNAGGGALGVTLGGSVKWEKSVEQETQDATMVVGTIDLVGRNFGASNAASWSLLENKSVETGCRPLCARRCCCSGLTLRASSRPSSRSGPRLIWCRRWARCLGARQRMIPSCMTRSCRRPTSCRRTMPTDSVTSTLGS